jgi:glycosyltransferase involved in cell wall biosynthesis
MHFFSLLLFGSIALFWLTHGLRVASGSIRLPWLKDFAPAADAECPGISILFAARDEEEKLPKALATLMEIDYPNLEVVAVDDRSKDSTGSILDEFAAAHARLRVVRVAQLPTGWLGKPHALQKGYEASKGEWLLFTDADVRFQSDALRRAISLAKGRNLDHLTLFADVEMEGFWEKVVITFFGLGFHLAIDPARVSSPRSSRYAGVGAFQLLRRFAYETSGTHRRLAMEVVDDMKLGKIVKQAGFRSDCGLASGFVSVRWHAGLANIAQGVTKNFFAAAGYNLKLLAAQVAGLVLMNILPFVGLFVGHGWTRLFCAIAVLIAVGFHAGVAMVSRVSPLYALTQPLGAVLFCYMLLRSTAVTLRQGGIVWRDTFYPLEELKRGVV